MFCEPTCLHDVNGDGVCTEGTDRLFADSGTIRLRGTVDPCTGVVCPAPDGCHFDGLCSDGVCIPQYALRTRANRTEGASRTLS